MKEYLEELRKSIDEIDSEILELILKRIICVKRVGHLKSQDGSRIYVPERENEIFKRLLKESEEKISLSGNLKSGDISARDIESIYTEIISLCRSKEKKIIVSGKCNECFFISQKIFGSNITFLEEEVINSPKKVDFRILKWDESIYSYLFNNLDFSYIVAIVENFGEKYVILGKDKNNMTPRSTTGIILKEKDKGSFSFVEIKGDNSGEKLEEWLNKISQSGKFLVKELGSYEKRSLDRE